jgi:hypothetical protein
MLVERIMNACAKVHDNTASQQTPPGANSVCGDKQASWNCWSESKLSQMSQVIPSLPLVKLKAEPVYGRMLGRGQKGVTMLACIEGNDA